MAAKTNIHAVLFRRLLPLYVAAFCHGFMLWYATEKLFMRDIGFDDAGIGVMVAAYSGLMLLIETPSGILADRWSRKGVLILGSIFLAASSLIGGLSTEPMLYIVSALFWGAFFAFYSGTYDSIVYDTVYEEAGNSDNYERYSGRVHVVESVALVLGSLLGGVMSQTLGLAATFYWSVPIALAAVVALWFFKEPQLHKSQIAVSLTAQVKATFKAITARGVVLRLVIVMLLLTIIVSMIDEFCTLWFIEINTAPVLFGPAYAIVLSAAGVGGLLVGWVGGGHRRAAMATAFAVMLVGSLVLVVPGAPLAMLVGAQFFISVSAIMLTIMVMRDVHDLLPSTIRAGAASAMSTFGRVTLIPISLLFGAISASQGVFVAGWILVALAALAAAGEVRHWLRGR